MPDTGLYSGKDVKSLEDVCRMTADFHKRMEKHLEVQHETIEKYGANTGKVADRLDKLEEEYKKNHEPAYREMRKEFGDIKAALDGMLVEHKKLAGVGGGGEDDYSYKSIGQRMAEHKGYTSLQREEEVVPGRHMQQIVLDDRKAAMEVLGGVRKWTHGLGGAIPNSSLTSFRDIFTTLRLNTLYAEPLREDRVRDYMPNIPVEGSSVEYWQQTDYASDGVRPNAWSGNQARFVSEGGTKPYSTMAGQAAVAPIRTLAHIFVMSEELMADSAAFARHVDVYMRGGIDEKEDVQLLKGSGSGSDLEGLLLRAGIQHFQQSVDSEPGDNELDMIARAASKVKRAGYAADTLLLGIGAALTLKLVKGTTGEYLWGTESAVGTGKPRIWGLAVSDTSALDDDEGVIGAFRMSTGLLDRMSTTLRVSDSHDILFEQNMVALRYEKRLGLMVVRTKGICSLDFDGRRQS